MIGRFARARRWMVHAFAVSSPEDAISPDEEALAERLARFLVGRRLTAPALAALEAGRPYSFLASQFMVFLAPFVALVFPPDQHRRFTRFLEKRASVDCLIRKIEDAEQEAH